jgi:hypothetical protein
VNCHTKLATESLMLKQQNIIPLQLAKAALLIDKLVVTNNHKQILRKYYLSIEYREYSIAANQWNQKVPEYIWWGVT